MLPGILTTIFPKYPILIRKNRNGVAVLSGNESKEELAGLAQDITQYFGLGCRSIAKLYLPKGYDLNLIFGALYPHANLMDSAKIRQQLRLQQSCLFDE